MQNPTPNPTTCFILFCPLCRMPRAAPHRSDDTKPVYSCSCPASEGPGRRTRTDLDQGELLLAAVVVAGGALVLLGAVRAVLVGVLVRRVHQLPRVLQRQRRPDAEPPERQTRPSPLRPPAGPLARAPPSLPASQSVSQSVSVSLSSLTHTPSRLHAPHHGPAT